MNNYSPYYSITNSRSSELTLMQRVSFLLCSALLVTSGAAYWADSVHLSYGLFLPLGIGTLVCVFALYQTRNHSLGLGLLYLLSVLEGLLMGPMLGAIARGYSMGSAIIGEAATLSAIIVAGIGAYVWISNKDFGGIGRTLMWALVGLLVVGLIGIFVHMSAGFHLIYAIAGAAIFVGFTLYDFSNIKHRYGPDQYVIATVGLYLDFLNLFWYLVQILMILGGGSRRN